MRDPCGLNACVCIQTHHRRSIKMDSLESDLVQPLVFIQSHNDLAIVTPRPKMGNRFMSTPDVRKRLPDFHLKSIKRRKVSRYITPDLDNSTIPTPSVSNHVKSQATVTATPQDPSLDEPSRGRRSVSQWLSQQAERFKKDRHRDDSLLSSEELEKELKILSQQANATVESPHGEKVPQRIIDHFFDLHWACGSDWRDSASWKAHQEECAQFKCNMCKDPRRASRSATEANRAPPQSPLSVSPQSSSLQKTKSPKPPKSPKGPYWCDFFRRSTSSDRQKRGKLPASDRTIDEGLISPKTQLSNFIQNPHATGLRPPNISADSYDKIVRRQSRKAIRCSIVSVPPGAVSLIPPPAISDKPESSEDFNPRNLAHQTGRPSRRSTIDSIKFPLPDYYKVHINTPPAPRIRPERSIEPIPGPLHLDHPTRSPSSDSLIFNISPLQSAGLSATNIHRGFYPLRDPDTVTPDEPYNITEIWAQDEYDGLQMRKTRNRKRDTTIRMIHSPAQFPTPAMHVQFPPTPPDSREGSCSWLKPADEKIGGIYAEKEVKVPPPAWSPRVPDSPADRDWDKCVVSDTTGSSVPDCPVYVNPAEKREGWWRSRHGKKHRGRHAPGMNIFRYACSNDGYECE